MYYEPETYLEIAGVAVVLVCGITYCAKNWDDPPVWWPNCLQPWWNKEEKPVVDKGYDQI